MYSIGTKVIVTTCSGEYRGKITGYARFSHTSIENDAYKVSGKNIQSTTRKVTLDDGRKLFKGATCDICENSEGCSFKE